MKCFLSILFDLMFFWRVIRVVLWYNVVILVFENILVFLVRFFIMMLFFRGVLLRWILKIFFFVFLFGSGIYIIWLIFLGWSSVLLIILGWFVVVIMIMFLSVFMLFSLVKSWVRMWLDIFDLLLFLLFLWCVVRVLILLKKMMDGVVVCVFWKIWKSDGKF